MQCWENEKQQKKTTKKQQQKQQKPHQPFPPPFLPHSPPPNTANPTEPTKMKLFVLICFAVLPFTKGMTCDVGATCVCDANPCDTFQCNAAMSCSSAVLVCDSDRCHMDCNAQKSCQASHMECLSDYCQIKCSQDQSCEAMAPLTSFTPPSSVSFDETGLLYGIYMSKRASTGKLICDGALSCQASTIAAGSKFFDTYCNGVQACQQSTFKGTSSCEGAKMACNNQQSCQQSTFDYRETKGDVEVVCSNVQGCQQAKVICPESHSCEIKCQNLESCKGMYITCPASLPLGKRCHLTCVGDNACLDIGKNQVQGALTADCTDNAGCGPFLRNGTASPATKTPATKTPSSLPALLRRLFRILIKILKAIFNKDNFTGALKTLLGPLVRGVTLHWTCPASSCTGGCATTAAEKLAAGCVPFPTDDITSRSAEALGDDNTVAEIEMFYTDTGSEALVEAALVREKTTPSAVFKDYEMEEISVVDTSVLRVEATTSPTEDSDDDDLGAGVIVMIVVVSLLCIIAVLVVLRYFRLKKEQASFTNTAPQEYKEMPEMNL